MPVIFRFVNSVWIASMFFRSVSLAIYTLPPQLSIVVKSSRLAIKLKPAMFSAREFSVMVICPANTAGAQHRMDCL